MKDINLENYELKLEIIELKRENKVLKNMVVYLFVACVILSGVSIYVLRLY